MSHGRWQRAGRVSAAYFCVIFPLVDNVGHFASVDFGVFGNVADRALRSPFGDELLRAPNAVHSLWLLVRLRGRREVDH